MTPSLATQWLLMVMTEKIIELISGKLGGGYLKFEPGFELGSEPGFELGSEPGF